MGILQLQIELSSQISSQKSGIILRIPLAFPNHNQMQGDCP